MRRFENNEKAVVFVKTSYFPYTRAVSRSAIRKTLRIARGSFLRIKVFVLLCCLFSYKVFIQSLIWFWLTFCNFQVTVVGRKAVSKLSRDIEAFALSRKILGGFSGFGIYPCSDTFTVCGKWKWSQIKHQFFFTSLFWKKWGRWNNFQLLETCLNNL